MTTSEIRKAETPQPVGVDGLEAAFVTAAVRNDQGAICDFRIEWANDAAVDFDGRPMHDFIGKTVLSVYPAMKAPDLFDIWVGVVETGEAAVCKDVRYDVISNGTPFGGWFNVQTSPHGDGCLHVVHQNVDGEQLRPLPSIPMPAVEGLDIGAFHHSAREYPATLLGGDWYDVFPVNGQVFAVVGDVIGHGHRVSPEMAQLRDVVRCYARLGLGPAQVMAECNKFLCELSPGVAATAVCARIDPSTRALRWAHAGHLPPVLCAGPLSAFLDVPNGLMLGVEHGARYSEARLVLPKDSTLLFYSDGLVETRDESLDARLEQLCAKVRSLSTVPAQELCRQLVDGVFDSHRSEDDICALALRTLA